MVSSDIIPYSKTDLGRYGYDDRTAELPERNNGRKP